MRTMILPFYASLLVVDGAPLDEAETAPPLQRQGLAHDDLDGGLRCDGSRDAAQRRQRAHHEALNQPHDEGKEKGQIRHQSPSALYCSARLV